MQSWLIDPKRKDDKVDEKLVTRTLMKASNVINVINSKHIDDITSEEVMQVGAVLYSLGGYLWRHENE